MKLRVGVRRLEEADGMKFVVKRAEKKVRGRVWRSWRGMRGGERREVLKCCDMEIVERGAWNS